MFKVMTLNLFRYHDWDKRMGNIVSLVHEQQPDFIAFQEVLTNHAFSDVPQSELLAEACGYKYRVFAPTLLRMNARDKDGNRTQQASEGQACISKYPIVSAESYFLRQYPDYPEDVSVLFCSVEIAGEVVELCNVHFANNDVAYKHLDELLELIEKRATTPIILGDFNIYKLAEYKSKSQPLDLYCISSEVSEYVSYPPDGESLDYIAVPKLEYTIIEAACPEVYVSDHKALLAVIRRR
jgi:endonuclease/exonuclease/phosphatase family metal-dependent hydrolase